MIAEFTSGDLVWFDPGIGYVLPGEILEYHRPAQVITVQAMINNVPKTFTLNNLSSVRKREDLGKSGVEDMVTLNDLNEASVLWNLRLRYDSNLIYTYTGSILVAVNPYRMFDIYGLDQVSMYENQIIGTLPPHLFAVGATAYSRMMSQGENQVLAITGESGAGKTETAKLILQYLAAVNKSSSNLVTEQILEANPLLESFGNAKTLRNDNSSRYGKFQEIFFKNGVISGSKITDYLLEKSRLVTHAPEERNFHVFYELLSGLTDEQKGKYGLMTAEKYFYLNQGGSCVIDGKMDGEDYQNLVSAMQVLGFTQEEQDVIFKIISSILHLGNVYFHRKQLKHGEGVEVGSDVEIKWAAHLLQLNVAGIVKAMVLKQREEKGEVITVPLNIDQALDARDALAKSLYSTLFSWIVSRLNKIISEKSSRRSPKSIVSILDFFGFEDFRENSFEQLCINYANENLHYFFNKHIFKIEQAEYSKEKIEWNPIPFTDNHGILHMLSKKPVGILHLLDDESNFPKASDLSFLEKCHYNHALNELYSRPRMNSLEFGIQHYAGQVWYNVEGFLEKNRDTLRYDVMGLLISSKEKMISKMFQDLRNFDESSRTLNKPNGQFITMKPRAATIAARFNDALHNLLGTMALANPLFVRCLKPNNDKCPMKFDMPVVLEQIRYLGLLETVRIRKLGYAVRVKYSSFVARYRCLVVNSLPRGRAPSKEISRYILDQLVTREHPHLRDDFQLGSTKIFMRENLEQILEKRRLDLHSMMIVKLQRHVRGYLARRNYMAMRRSATTIQKTFRGYQVRKEYQTVRTGIVKLQAIYKMKKQKSLYGEMRQRAEMERQARELAMERAKLKAERSPSIPSIPAAQKAGSMESGLHGVNHLEIPADLAFIFRELEKWTPINTEKNLAKVSGNLHQIRTKTRLPRDIDYSSFSKFSNINFKTHLWGMRKEPIKTPFLTKSKERDFNEAIAVFKIILRFMNDPSLSGQNEKLLGDYIINKGIRNEKLRDEIYCQLANQTYKNDDESNAERGWLLMACCLSSFPPSSGLYRYLLKYVSDHAYNGYKFVCQDKLLKMMKKEEAACRVFPPTVLEWRANKKKVNMALEVSCYDGESKHIPVESSTTAHDFAMHVLQERGVPECYGWTVSIEDAFENIQLNGDDFVLDAIGELELPPTFPANVNPFLVCHDRSRGQIPPLSGGGQKDGRQYRHSASPRGNGGQKQPADYKNRSRSTERLLSMPPADSKDFGLSKSALNERYFSDVKSTRSKSLDNLLPTPAVEENFFGLSESKLNQRYLSQGGLFGRAEDEESIHMESVSQRGGKQTNWDEIGLDSKSSRNYRFLSQPDLGGAGAQFDKDANLPRSYSNREDKLDIDLAQFEYPRGQDIKENRNKRLGKYGKGKRRDGLRSSALSDTSEAPSLASHVRRVRVPSQASDVDQFLDDLFMPVLDTNIDDGLSDARSLAASMRGGGGEVEELKNGAKENKMTEASNMIEFQRIGSFKRKSLLPQMDTSLEEETPEELVSRIMGGGSPTNQPKSPRKQSDFTPRVSSGMGFHPIQGVISPQPGMISPPPMIVPTPVNSTGLFSMGNQLPSSLNGMTSPLLMQSGESQQPAMAFTYVPVPVYSLGGMQMTGMPGMSGIPGMSGFPSFSNIQASSPDVGESSQSPQTPHQGQGGHEQGREPAATSTPLSPPISSLSVDSQLAYQTTFLQNAVAQNMQIQQQLLMQNQALTALLQQTNSLSLSGNASFTPEGEKSSNEGMQGVMPGKSPFYFGMEDFQQQQQQYRRASEYIAKQTEDGSVNMVPKSKTAPNTPKTSTKQLEAPVIPAGYMDAYSRARTVRIGKWRWPPPREDGMTAEEGFFQFKMRKMKNKEGKEQGGDNDGFDDDTLEWGEGPDEDRDERDLEPAAGKSANNKDDTNSKEKEGGGGGVGKLKLSSDMKEKLEAAMGGSRKSSIRSKSDIESEKGDTDAGVKKLNENRKLLLQQQLGAGKLKKWENIDQELNRASVEPGSRKTSGGVDKDGIPIPPPPPVAPGLTKPLHIETGGAGNDDQNGPPSESTLSSFYSGGMAEEELHLRYSRTGSVTASRADKLSKYEFEDSIDVRHRDQRIMDEVDYQGAAKTKLHAPASQTFFSYNRVPWKLKVRKEVFSPGEELNSLQAIHLVFCQIISDAYSPLCIRLNQQERRNLLTFLAQNKISMENMHSSQHKNSIKKILIQQVKEFSTYFCRIYPLLNSSQDVEYQYIGISHNGVSLLRREKSLPTDYLKVVEFYKWEEMDETSRLKASVLQISLNNGSSLQIQTANAGNIRNLIEQFSLEAKSSNIQYSRAVADFTSRDDDALPLRKGDLVGVVRKDDRYTQRGWLYGFRHGRYGLFPAEYVEKLSPNSIRREIKTISTLNEAKDNSRDSREREIVSGQRNGHGGGVDRGVESLDEEDIRKIVHSDSDHDSSGEEAWGSRKQESFEAGNISDVSLNEINASQQAWNDGKHPLLEFAISSFRESNFELPDPQGGKGDKKKKKKKGGKSKDWTWKDQVEMVKWTDRCIENSLLILEPHDLNKIAVECFASIMRYMGDLELLKNQHEVDCALTVLGYCYKFEALRDEVYCQIMKQTTNNKSRQLDSCQKGWRLFSIIAAYFTCSDLLKPFLFKYLETTAYDKRRAYHGTALVCLHNLRKTFKYGGRKMAPSIDEITAISAGRNSKRQIYRLPGGTERVINTKSTTVVDDIVEELCKVIGVTSMKEREEFSLYCIIEGQTFTRPLYKDQYILDVTTDLVKQGAVFYLIFCRSVWHYPLRLDNKLYIEVVFNQIAPDYLEGLLLVMPGEQIDQDTVYQVAKVAALLHKAADMDHKPTLKETKYLLPKPALSARDIKPPQWVNMVQSSWAEVEELSSSGAKAKVLEILSQWQLFGSCFFSVRRENDPGEESEHILALNKHGVHFLDLITHETIIHYPFTEVISTRKMETEDGALFLDMKCGNLMQQRITRIQTDQAVEIARLIKQYITIDQKTRGMTLDSSSIPVSRSMSRSPEKP